MTAAPATDGRGQQDEYADAVDRWCDFHDLLEEKNSNRIPPKLRRRVLWAQFSDRTKDCARQIPRSILMSENGSKAIFSAVHPRDTLSVVSVEYEDFSLLVSACRADI